MEHGLLDESGEGQGVDGGQVVHVAVMIWRSRWQACLACLLVVFSAGASADGEYVERHGDVREGAAGTWRTIGAYPGEDGRQGHTVTVLPDGNVVVYGAVPEGATENGALLLDPVKRISKAQFGRPAAVRWDAKQHAWADIGRPPQCPHTSFLHSSTLLPGGRILYAGGICDVPRLANDDSPYPPPFNQMSLWNDVARQWESAPSLTEARVYHTATPLADGNVIFIGGERDRMGAGGTEPVLDSVELFRAASDAGPAGVVQLPGLHHARAKHSATLLSDGRLVVAGGMGGDRKPIASVEIWDPRLQAWQEGPALNVPRHGHSAVLLSDGRLMVLGGMDGQGKPTSSVEVLDVSGHAWTAAAPLLHPLRSQAALALGDGDVLVVGTSFDIYRHTVSSAMLWRHAAQQWRPAGLLKPDLAADIGADENYVLLPDQGGGALLFGQRLIMQWSPSPAGASEYLPSLQRDGHTAAVLKDGRILIAGGRLADAPSDLAEIYDPSTNRFTLTGRMRQPRMTGMPFQASLPAVVTDDGRVVVAGGWVKRPDGSGESIANHAEVWDPATGQWDIIEGLRFEAQERVYLGKLSDGRVMFFASWELADETIPAAYRVLIWDPLSRNVKAVPINVQARANAGIALLGDGRVLIVGGQKTEWVPEYRCPQRDSEDGCRDEPAHWQAYENRTAEVWDSRTGKASVVTFPTGWYASSPQTLVLKTGKVLLVNAETPQVFGNGYPRPLWVWDAHDGSWSELPSLRGDMNWPMTELSDGSIVAWAAGNVNPTHANWLKPGASAWEPVPRFPQARATVVQPESGDVLSLSLAEPYVATFDREARVWTLKLFRYMETEQPVPVELGDGRVAVLGGILGNRKIVQVWDPRTDTWSASGKTAEGRPTGKAVRLPSGRVLHMAYGAIGSLLCEVWQPTDDSWQSCGTLTGERKDSYPKFVLGSLEDGRAVFMGAAQSAFVFDEGTNAWTNMQVEWNEKSYLFGVGVRADKPFARFFDPQKNEWLDASVVAGKFYSMPNEGRISPPAMLWDPKRRQWAYMNYKIMGRNGYWLPDGCAISGPPFRIFDPVTGKVAEHRGLEAPWMRAEAMTVLHDGTVVVAGGDATGPKFFHRKATCSGFEALPEDGLLMPAHGEIEFALPAPAEGMPPVEVQAGWRDRVTAVFNEYRWIALAVLVPLLAYRLLRSLIVRLQEARPDSVLTRPLKPSRGGRLLAFGVRAVIYGALAIIIVVPTIFGIVVSRLDDMGSEDKRQVAVPCRYVGIWSLYAKGMAHRITLKADGQFIYEETYLPHSVSTPVTGRWEVQGENMVWHYGRPGEEPDVNRILEQGEHSFTLLEMNGVRTRFELIEPIASDTCSR